MPDDPNTAADSNFCNPTPDASARRWSNAYPVENPDRIQRLLDPLLNCQLFSATVFALIIYSMYNLYETYQVRTPLALTQLRQVSLIISAIFMIEFLLRFASRRSAYLRREGLIDFLAACDVFSPAVRAAKVVRFLRVLRLLRVIRGIRMVQSKPSRIEENVFSSFATATIVVMLIFVSIKSHMDWRTTKNRVHERLIPILVSVEKRLQTDADGKISITDELAEAEIALVEHPDFVNAVHYPPGKATADWQLAAKRELDTDRLQQVIGEVDIAFSQAKNARPLAGDEETFLERQVLAQLRGTTTPAMFDRVKRMLYLKRQEVDAEAFRTVLGNTLALLDTVPVYLSRVEPQDIAGHIDNLYQNHFSEEFLTIRRDSASGFLVYRFLVDEEYYEAREDEFRMLLATFALIMVMMLVLNIAIRGVLTPLAQMREQTEDMALMGTLRPLELTPRPDNEIAEIADNINRAIQRDAEPPPATDALPEPENRE